MATYNRVGSGDLQALLSTDGSAIKPDENGECALTAATYYFALGGYAPATLGSVHVKCDANIAVTFTIESCNFPAYKGGTASGTVDIADWNTGAGNWIPENPSTAYIPTTASAGFTVTNATVVKTAGAAGGFVIHAGNLGTKRLRLKAVVTTPGKVRVNPAGKA